MVKPILYEIIVTFKDGTSHGAVKLSKWSMNRLNAYYMNKYKDWSRITISVIKIKGDK